MEERLEKALAFSEYRKTIDNRKKALRRRYKNMLSVHYANGQFVADQATIAFVGALANSDYKSAVILDVKENAIEITDILEFRDSLLESYFQATNEYSVEMARLAKARNIKKAMDW
jgi:hypothetical protein